ncbi:Gfo/Idh/MocA family oxidoreductase [Labilibacter marinus]|uniref:Gfo/Idh/MocA family oxidoreductase n=1 Tax=Labilibacter marinus TaxID=1477105 RepID=UPI00082B4A1F|nr:Gfo/Idh/MocA family oxidoreductase [Labilibacter marinus]
MKNLSRRSFLKKSAVVAGGAMVAPTIISSCVKGANDKILIGHIGVGNMGSVALRNWFMPIPDALNVATCDPFKDRRVGRAQWIDRTYKEKEIAAPQAKAYRDFEELLERKDIDAVQIHTPDHWHVPIAIKAARAGKHIMVAKPLGLSYENYKILEKECKDNDVKFHYGTQQRSMAHLKLANQFIKEGRIGEIHKVDAWCAGRGGKSPEFLAAPVPEGLDYDLWTGPAKLLPYCADRVTPQGAWFQYNYALGFIAGWGAHPLDQMVWAIKDQVKGRYTCDGKGTIYDGGLYDTVKSWDLNIEYESGLKLHFVSADVAGKNGMKSERKVEDGNGTTFHGSKGWVSIGRNSAESNIPELQKAFDQFSENGKTARIKQSGSSIGQDFVDVIRGKMPETCPLDEAIMSDTISHMGNIAIRTESKITWNPQTGIVSGASNANEMFNRDMRSPYTV